ncbi:MAG TPA: 5-oxoprolinase subunit PxpB [Verrucomicrobiae bacterium]|nr:5-oxoprolinase subunit PxpB [Verrucomicrobiae bacterium]
MSLQVERLGESALVADAGTPETFASQRRMWALARAARQLPGVDDAVIGANNLTLFLREPERWRELERALQAAWKEGAMLETGAARSVEIPVAYGGESGPDAASLARICGMAEAELVILHARPQYVVSFLGFVAGFAYLGGLDERLHAARRAEPRAAVPAGSVAIGGTYTGVYPRSTPGGWHLIGRTEETLFDPRREPPALLAPGDRVRFVPLT